MKILGSVFCWVLCVALTACSSGGGTGGIGPVTAASFPEAAVGAVCANRSRCLIADDDASEARVLRNAVGDRYCTDAFSSALRDYRYLASAVQAGRIRFDDAQARACIDSLTATCLPDDSDPVARLCRGVFTGSVPIAGACIRSEECLAGAWCDTSMATSMTCGGSCQPRRAVGAECNGSGSGCASADNNSWGVCIYDSASSTSRCATSRLGMPVAVGQPCGRLRGGPSDFITVPCSSGLWCSSETEQGVCRTPIPAGMPCNDRDDVCADGSLCMGSSSSRACATVTIIASEGGSCNASGPPYCNPYLQLLCVSGACRRLSDGRAGSLCAMTTTDPGSGTTTTRRVSCEAGLVCGTSNVCTSALPNGAMCTAGRQCVSGYCNFSGSSGVCAVVGC